jgi:hypothetical protein
MFGRTRDLRVVDHELGSLERRRGVWRGQVSVGPFGSVPLHVPGSRSAPDDDALVLARTAAAEFDRCRMMIAAALADHRAPYDPEDATTVSIAPSYVAVTRLDRRLALEFGYRVPWDAEHTVGARVRDGDLLELCGSVVEP